MNRAPIVLLALLATTGPAMALAPAPGAPALPGCEEAHLDAPASVEAQLAAAGLGALELVAAPSVVPEEGLDTHACSGKIRPGVRMTSPVGCTMSWILRDTQGLLYQTTAGHCTGSIGQSVSVLGVSGSIGTVVYRINAGVGKDIALIRIHASQYANVEPTLCHWGGPTGVATGPEDPGADVVLHQGWGVMWSGTPTRARVGALPNSGWFAEYVRFRGLVDGGDSGSPVMMDGGNAIGVITHRVVVVLPNVPSNELIATRLDVYIPRMETALGLDLDLVPGLPVDLTGLTIP